MSNKVDFRQWAAQYDSEARLISIAGDGYSTEISVPKYVPISDAGLSAACDGSPGSFPRLLDMLVNMGYSSWSAYYAGYAEGMVGANPLFVKAVN